MTKSRVAGLAVLLACATAAVGQVVASSDAPWLQAPQITFVNVSRAPVGATNATGNNVAGATNATIGNVPLFSAASISVPIVIGGDQAGNISNAVDQQQLPPLVDEGPGMFDVGPADADQSLAQLARAARAQRKATRVYTNEDISRQQSGIK